MTNWKIVHYAQKQCDSHATSGVYDKKVVSTSVVLHEFFI